MVDKAKFGERHTCPSCEGKFYDMNRSRLICPRCGFDPDAVVEPEEEIAIEVEPELAESETPVDTDLVEILDEAVPDGKVPGVEKPEKEGEAEKAVKKKAPKAKKEAPKVKKEAPKAKKEAPKVKKEAPKVKKEAPKVKKEAPKVKKEAPKVKKEAPKVKKEAPKAKKSKKASEAS